MRRVYMSTPRDVSAGESAAETPSPANIIMRPTSNQRPVDHDACINHKAIEIELSFDSYCGRDVIVSGRTAVRHAIGNGAASSQQLTIDLDTRCYVFGNRPLQCGVIENFSIVILDVEPRSSQGLTFGMTSCDPSLLRSMDDGDSNILPTDPDELMDRSEYWIVVKNLLSGTSNSDEGDVLTFQLNDSGEVRLIKNGDLVQTLMYIDKTLPMWPFVNINGRVTQIAVFDCNNDRSRDHVMSTSNSESTNVQGRANRTNNNQTLKQSPLSDSCVPGEVIEDLQRSLLEEFQMLARCKRTTSLPSSAERRPDLEIFQTPPTSPLTALVSSIDDDVTSQVPHRSNDERSVMRAMFDQPPTLHEVHSLRSSQNIDATPTLQSRVKRTASLFESRQKQQQQQQTSTIQRSLNRTDNANYKMYPQHPNDHKPLVNSAPGFRPPVASRTSSGINTPSSANLSTSTSNDDQNSDAASVEPRSRLAKRQAPPVPSRHHAAKPGPVTHRTQSVDAGEIPNRSSIRLLKEASVDIKNETVGQLSECCLCLDKLSDSVIYRCGHMCVCYECGLEIQQSHSPSLCPICRQPISDIIKIYKA